MTTKPRPRRFLQRRSGRLLIVSVAVLQIVCGAFFVYDLAAHIFGWRTAPISWTWREILEVMAVVGLVLGMALGAMLVRNLLMQRRLADERLRVASGEFFGVVQDRFEDWGLTPSERDVAIFMLKGLSNAEIAGLRETSEGTIKAQSTAVFRKAGVSGRAQLLSVFIEDMLAAQA